MKWPALWRVLKKKPLGYSVDRQKGSHRTLKSSAGYPDLHLAFHDKQDLPGSLVRKILCDDVGLAEDVARGLI